MNLPTTAARLGSGSRKTESGAGLGTAGPHFLACREQCTATLLERHGERIQETAKHRSCVPCSLLARQENGGGDVQFRIERKRFDGRYHAVRGLVYANRKSARTALRRIGSKPGIKLRLGRAK